LNHLTPNGVLHLSVCVHFCEAFLGILPSITPFYYFFVWNYTLRPTTLLFLVGVWSNFIGMKTKMIISDFWKSFLSFFWFLGLNGNGSGNRKNENDNGKNNQKQKQKWFCLFRSFSKIPVFNR
jgi:hypothetical protein